MLFIPRISYIPISIPVYTKDTTLSKMFIDFVLSPKGMKIYEKFGYISNKDKAKEFAPLATIGGEFTLSEGYFKFINNHWKKK